MGENMGKMLGPYQAAVIECQLLRVAMSEPANTQREYRITRDQLPLSCPTDKMAVWNSHPKVYLPIEKEGKIVCPYCGATYILED